MGYTENPLIIDKKFSKVVNEVNEAVKHPEAKKSGVEKQGSPLNWIMQAAGAVAGGVGAALSGGDVKDVLTAAGTGALSPTSAVSTLSTGIGDKMNEKKVAEAEANEKANAEANATLEQNNSNMNLSSGGYGKEVEGIDASQSVFSNSTLDPNLTTDPTGASTTGSTAVAKKLGEVKPYYENLKMSAAQYKKAAAMMTVSGVSSLNKKGCYKPK
jgi:hypothetical protein